MFTGIIEETGKMDYLNLRGRGASLSVSAKTIPPSLKAGDSIAVNGVCVTAVLVETGHFECDLSAETLDRTSLPRIREGVDVNLERAALVGSRMGGHFVLGHVDGVGTLLGTAPSGTGAEMTFGFPLELARYLVFKGSIAVDGISLTIASLEETSFSVAVIPYTLEHTNLRCLTIGDPVNLEVDILGKYFERYYQLGLLDGSNRGISLAYLKEQGF